MKNKADKPTSATNAANSADILNKHTLPNGLRIVHIERKTTSMVAINVLYKVGARDEDPQKTGFAHLFEHLMFGGSANIPNYDQPLQLAGAENNAWTSNDITNYYINIPAQNVETAFWLESDRMLKLNFSQKSLDVQKNVVIEEFKQRSLNQPYGDVHKILRNLCYRHHPYRWCTIGKDPEHIANASLQEVEAFFYRHYAPNNAILSVVGNITFDEVIRLAQKWFAPIPRREVATRHMPQEPPQTEARFEQVERHVPAHVIYKAYHMPARMDARYPVCDLISDLFANGKSSRLQQALVQEQKLFSSIDANVMGSIDPGLFIISGKPNHAVSLQEADQAIQAEIQRLLAHDISDYEMQKVKNKYESSYRFALLDATDVASEIAYYELLGDANLFFKQVENYHATSPHDVKKVGEELFRPENTSTLYYKAIQTQAEE